MTGLTMSQSDLENLAAKLDASAGELTERERALLVAVFTLAGEAVAARRQLEQEVSGFGGDGTAVFTLATPGGPIPSFGEVVSAHLGGGSGQPGPKERLTWNFSEIVISYTKWR